MSEQQLTVAQVEVWLTERWMNCLTIAAMKQGEDKMGWLEDAVYFQTTLEYIYAAALSLNALSKERQS